MNPSVASAAADVAAIKIANLGFGILPEGFDGIKFLQRSELIIRVDDEMLNKSIQRFHDARTAAVRAALELKPAPHSQPSPAFSFSPLPSQRGFGIAPAAPSPLPE